jgi:adenylyltransferase/sulfurtransferase
MMTDESQETILGSESTSSTSDHVVLSSSAIQEAQHEQLLQNEVAFQQHMAHGQMMQLLGQRPSSIVRQWFDDMKTRVATQLLTPGTDQQNQHDDEYYLVPDSAAAGHIYTSEHDDDDDMDVVVDIHSDPFVELMLENRIVKLETDLEACEIEYQRRIQTLERELQRQSFARVKEKSDHQHRMDELEANAMMKNVEEQKIKEQMAQHVQELEAQVASLLQQSEASNSLMRVTKGDLDGLIRGLEAQHLVLQREADELRAANGSAQSRLHELEAQVTMLQQENESLVLRAATAVVEQERMKQVEPEKVAEVVPDDPGAEVVENLSADHIMRYSRQLLLQDGFGTDGQKKLLSSSVLVVGAGGIGSTVLMYLAASGVGHISVVDFDEVDMSNLHRQVIHTEANVGVNKAVSACQAVKALNPSIRCTPIQEVLTFDNARDIVASHDCVVDASDNPRTRYLINDACVLTKKPLVSGSAMGTEGQLTVYNHKDGPCYRCLYPKPNVSEGCKSCSDNGVLGPVPGLIGILQSLEVIKLITGTGTTMHDRLLMYDALRCSFVNIKKPPKSKKCPICSDTASIHSMEDSKSVSELARGPTGAVEGCELVSPPSIAKDLAIECVEYDKIRKGGDAHVLLDVRVKQQFDMCSLDGAVNIPLEDLQNQLDRLEKLSEGTKPIYCICRRGIASIEATKQIEKVMDERSGIHSVKNISGGLKAWSRKVDESFPEY